MSPNSFRHAAARLIAVTALVAIIGCTSAPEAPTHVSPPPLESGLRYVIYYNSDATPFAAVADAGYTHVIVSFLRAYVTTEGTIALIEPTKMEGQWESVETVRAAGKRVMISFGGGEFGTKDYQPLIGHEEDLATAIATFVKERDLDGVDTSYLTFLFLFCRNRT
jgi:hypothetical protein